MIVANGTADVSTYWVLRDSTNHAPKTDVTVGDIDVYYQLPGAAQSAKADLTALDAADSAHADNKGYHVGNGMYRIDWPDTCFDGGVGTKVWLIVVCTGVDTTFLEVELSPAVNTVAVGGTTQTAGDIVGAVITNAAGTDVAADIIAIKTVVDTIQADTDLLDDAAGGIADIHTDVGTLLTNVGTPVNTGGTATLAAILGDPANSSFVTRIAAVKTDTGNLLTKLLKYVQLMVRKDAAIATDNATELTAINADGGSGGGAFSNQTDSEEALRDRGDAAWTTATGFETAGAAAAAVATLNDFDPTTDPVTLDNAQGDITFGQIKIVKSIASEGALHIVNAHADGIGMYVDGGDIGAEHSGGTIGEYNVADSAGGKGQQNEASGANGVGQYDYASNTGGVGQSNYGDATGLVAACPSGDEVSPMWAQPGDEMDLVDAPNSTAVTAIQNGLAATGEAATAAGAVTVAGYATDKSPADLVLATPAQKLVTDSSGRVTVGSNADKSGYSGTATNMVAAAPTAVENADALLGRNIAGGSSAGRLVKDALRVLRNKVAISSGTMTVYQENDTDAAWTAEVTEDADADPITAVDPE